MSVVLTLVGTALALVGAGLIAVAAAGLHRVDGTLSRLHVAAKASSTGILACLAGAGIASQDVAVALELTLTGALLTATVPLATHGLARAQVNSTVPAGSVVPAGGIVADPVVASDERARR